MSEQLTGISSMATRQVLAELVAGLRAAVGAAGGHRIGRWRGGCSGASRTANRSTSSCSPPTRSIGWLATASSIRKAASISRDRAWRSRSRRARRAPDIATEAAVRDAVLAARTIGYSTGPSGVHLGRLFERWGIAETIAPRIVQAPPGVPVGSLVASGQVELGFQQLSEMMHLPGIDVIGALPPEIQVVTVFSAAVCTASRQKEAAQELIAFLASAQAGSAKLRHGMEPA